MTERDLEISTAEVLALHFVGPFIIVGVDLSHHTNCHTDILWVGESFSCFVICCKYVVGYQEHLERSLGQPYLNLEPIIYLSSGNAQAFLKYFPNRSAGFLSEFCFHAVGFLLCSKRHLQATSIASFKWHLAVNETYFAFILIRNLWINPRGWCQIVSWESGWWGTVNFMWRSITT